MKQIFLYGIIAGTAAVILAAVGIVFSQSPSIQDQQSTGYPAASLTNTNNGIVPLPETNHRSPPQPYDIQVNGFNAAAGVSKVVTIPAGESKTLDVVVIPKLAGVNGTIYTMPSLPKCGSPEASNPNIKCSDTGGITATLSQTNIPTSAANNLAPTLLKMTINVPSTAPQGDYDYQVVTRTNYTWPDGFVSHTGMTDVITIEVTGPIGGATSTK